MARYLRYAELLTWNECEALIKRGRNGRKKLASNVYLQSGIDWHGKQYFEVILYDTTIIKLFKDDTFRLYMGNWPTATTRKRLYEFAYAPVIQSKWKQYLSINGQHIPFFDGIEFKPGV